MDTIAGRWGGGGARGTGMLVLEGRGGELIGGKLMILLLWSLLLWSLLLLLLSLPLLMSVLLLLLSGGLAMLME